MNKSNKEMPFFEHVEELRWCIVKSLIAICFGTIIAYQISDFIIFYLIEPSKDLDIKLNFQVLKVTSMFNIKLITSIFGGLIISAPIILYQIWRFVAPAFSRVNNLVTIFIFLAMLLFFLLGMFFAYFIIVPYSLNFLTSFQSSYLKISYNFTLSNYLSFIIWIMLGCGFIFQIPIITVLLSYLKILTSEFLRQYRKVAIIFAMIVGAILTPPDPFSQILVVVPIIILYEISIIFSSFFGAKY